MPAQIPQMQTPKIESLKRRPFQKALALALLAAAALVSLSRPAAAQTFTAPAAATSSQSTLYSNGNATLAIAVDAAGNLFFTQPGVGSFVEDPAGGGPQITLIGGSLSYPKGVAVDNAGFAYTTDYHGHLWQVPAGGGTAVDILAPCNPIDAYYLGTQAVAVDGARNVYTAGNNETSLFKITQAGACSVVAGVTLDSNSHVAADPAGNLAYSTGGTLYSLPVGATAGVPVVHTFDAINGLRADAFGNVFVSTNSTITEVPFLNGALSGANAFIVLPYSSSYDVAISPTGTLYTTADGTNILRSFSGSVQLPATPVGTTSAAQTATVVFNSAQTLTGIRYAAGAGMSTELASTGAGTCAIGQVYAAGASCTLILTATPSTIGVRNGAVVLSSATGTLGTLTVAVQGSGAGLVADPGTQSTLGAGFTAPSGIAVSPSGGVVVADKTAGTVSYFAAGSTTSTVIAAALTQPAGLAIAPSGTVYVANTGANNIVAIPYSGTAYGTAAIAVAGLKAPSAVALAPTGDLYIANTGAGTVLRVPAQGGTLNPLEMANVAATFTAPSGLAVDAAGDLFVADSSAGTITEISAAGTTSTLSSGLKAPGALAVDDSGTLYVQQTGVATILRIPFSNGAFNSNATTQLGTGLTAPSSLAADTLANLYITDSGAPAVVKLQRIAGTLSFGRVNVGATSASQSEILSNNGDLGNKLTTPLYTASGNTGDFVITGTGTSACSAGGTLTAGAACSVSGTFTPTANGTRAETLAFTSTAAPITVVFTGSGVNLAKTTVTLTQVAPQGSVTFGQAVTVSAAVTSTSGTPTGTIQFSVNGVAFGSPVGLMNGAASIVLNGLPGGTNTITATYSGDNNFASGTGMALTIVVAPIATTTTLTSSIPATPVPPGTSITLTATVSSTLKTSSPTGTVTFSNGAVTLGTVAVSPSGLAVLTSTTFPAGTYNATAMYGGDTGFAASTSNAVPLSILPPQYVVTNTPASVTVVSPGSTATSFLVSPVSGYTGGVDMSCSGLPANTQCSFAPGVVYFATTATPPQTITLTILTNTPAPTTVAGFLLPLGGLLLVGSWRMRRRFARHGLLSAMLALVASATMLAGLSGCSNSNFNATPKGTSTVTVNFIGTPSGTAAIPTSGAGDILKSFTFTLTVQ